MSLIYQDVLHAAMALPIEQRSQLADELLDSLPAEHAPPLDDEWRAIIRLRWQEYKEGRVQTIPWEDVQARARERIRKHD
ncbi:MAG: addiction module protein [Planctomycetes bacterium]|nr:addiction module protein [Planctomycetota bacterium]